MTQGIILYLQGSREAPAGLNPGAHYKGLYLGTDPLEVVVAQHGSLELEEAWHFLLTRGCDPIHLLLTWPEPDRLRPTYPLVRLSGAQLEGLEGACSKRRGLQ